MKALVLAALAAAPASACSVCFGAYDSAKGFFDGLGWAIVLLIGTTLCILAVIARVLWNVERRRAEADA